MFFFTPVFRSDWATTIERNRRRSSLYVEDFAIEASRTGVLEADSPVDCPGAGSGGKVVQSGLKTGCKNAKLFFDGPLLVLRPLAAGEGSPSPSKKYLKKNGLPVVY